jgi:hypothetical protein
LSPTATKAIQLARAASASTIRVEGADALIRELRGATAISLVTAALAAVVVHFVVGASVAALASIVAGAAAGFVAAHRRNRVELRRLDEELASD